MVFRVREKMRQARNERGTTMDRNDPNHPMGMMNDEFLAILKDIVNKRDATAWDKDQVNLGDLKDAIEGWMDLCLDPARSVRKLQIIEPADLVMDMGKRDPNQWSTRWALPLLIQHIASGAVLWRLVNNPKDYEEMRAVVVKAHEGEKDNPNPEDKAK